MRYKQYKFTIAIIVLIMVVSLLYSCNTIADITINFEVDGVIIASINVSQTQLKLPDDPEKDGFEFIGWFWDKDEWEQPLTTGSLIDAPLKNVLTVYALWRSENEYTMTFESNGGSEVDSITQEAGEVLSKPDDPYRADYYFDGWYTDNETFSTDYNFTVMPEENITLYAKWTAFSDSCSIVTATDFELVGQTLNLNVKNNIEEYNFINKITTSGNSAWILTRDIEGTIVVNSKYIGNLEEGDNQFYIIVKAANQTDQQKYTVNIRRNPKYKVTWQFLDIEEYIEEGELIEFKNADKGRFLAKEWMVGDTVWDFEAGKINDEIVLSPVWSTNSQRPNFASGLSADELSIINNALDDDATEEQIKTAVLTLFDAANRIQLESDLMLAITDGDGYAKTGAEGKMLFSSFAFKYSDAYYSQTAAAVIEAFIGGLLPGPILTAARNMLDQLNRVYTDDMETFYQSKATSGKNAKRPDISAYEYFPYVSADFSGCDNKVFDFEDYMIEAGAINTPFELNNLAFNKDSIKDAVIQYNAIEGYYTINFALDISKKDTKAYEDTVMYARDKLREAAGSTDLDYVAYNLSIEIWDNGYIRTYSATESWEATIRVLVDIEGLSESNSIVSYYWNWEEIESIIKENDDFSDVSTAQGLLNKLKPDWID